MREEAKLWIDDAYRSLRIAEEVFDKTFYEVTVFYCQQSLEKLLKGCIIAFKKTSPRKTHRLASLYDKLKKIVPLDGELVDFLHVITPYYRIARYPNAAMGMPSDVITKRFAEETIKKTKRIFQCFEKKLLKV